MCVTVEVKLFTILSHNVSFTGPVLSARQICKQYSNPGYLSTGAKSKWIRTTTGNHFLTLLSFTRHGRVIRLESSSYLSTGSRSCMGTFIRMLGIRRFTSFLSTICDVLSVYINMRVHIDEAQKKCLYYQTTGRNRAIRSDVQCKKSIEQPATV